MMETKRYRVPTGPNGASMALGTILDIDDDGYAHVRLDIGTITKVPVRTAKGKGFQPRVGERWMLDTHHGMGWQFAAYLGATDEREDGWQAPDFNGTWDNFSNPAVAWVAGTAHYASAAYRLDVDQVVRLRGTVAGPSVSAGDAAGPSAADIFQLPDWALPDADGIQTFVTASGQVKVYPDGWVRAATGSAAKVVLDGVAFLAA